MQPSSHPRNGSGRKPGCLMMLDECAAAYYLLYQNIHQFWYSFHRFWILDTFRRSPSIKIAKLVQFPPHLGQALSHLNDADLLNPRYCCNWGALPIRWISLLQFLQHGLSTSRQQWDPASARVLAELDGWPFRAHSISQNILWPFLWLAGRTCALLVNEESIS